MKTRFGCLEIPDNATVLACEDGEFGVLHRVKRSAYLYSTIPSPVLVSAVNRRNIHQAPLGRQAFPAIMTTDAVSESVGVFGRLPKNEEVLAREVVGRPDVLEVVQFKAIDNRRADMRETGDAIEIASKGYVLKKDLSDPLHSARFVTIHEPIFKNENLIDDVKQYSFGNCFLLASVLAILNREDGSDYIRSMMIQDGDYTIVRLHHPETLQPLYVRVKNSFYSENGKSAVKHQAPWVHVLEKAYSAAGFKKQDKELVVSFPAFREMYGDGGHATTALAVLTGQPATRKKVVVERGYPWTAMDWMLCMSVYVQTAYLSDRFPDEESDTLKELDVFLGNSKEAKLNELEAQLHEGGTTLIESGFPEAVIEAINASDDENKLRLIHEVLSYVEKYYQLWCVEKPQITEVFKSIGEMKLAGEYIHGLLVANKLSDFLQIETPVEHFKDVEDYFGRIKEFDPAPPHFVLGAYRRFVDEKTTYWSLPDDKVLYNDEAEALFNDVSNAFTQAPCGALVAQTKKVLPGDKFPGLRPQHAYAITGVCEEQVGDSGSLHKFIKVRNPWGHTGIKYHCDDQQRVGIAEDAASAEFKVELSHFIDYFSSYTEGAFRSAPTMSQKNEDDLNRVYAANDVLLAKPDFLGRHGVKMMMGVLAASVLVIAGLLTFGVAPLVLVGVPALIVAIAGASMLMGAALGAGVGALSGVVEDAVATENKAIGRHTGFIAAGLGVKPGASESDFSSSEEVSATGGLFFHPNIKPVDPVSRSLPGLHHLRQQA